MIVKTGVLLIALGTLTACQSMGPQARGPSASEIMASDPTKACMGRLNTDPFIVEQLGSKLGIGNDAPPTLQMLADRSKPNEQQKEALSMFSAQRDKCVSYGASYRRANMPAQVVLTLETNAQKLSILLARLYAGDITFGEFSTARSENMMGARAQISEGDRQRQQMRLEDERRRQENVNNALQNFNNQMLLQQQINNQNRARTTNCQRWGQQVNCTTY